MITNVDDLLELPTNVPDGVFTNAEQIQGVPVDNTNIGNGKVLAYNSTDDKLEYVTSARVYRDWETDRKSTRLNSSHSAKSRMPSSA